MTKNHKQGWDVELEMATVSLLLSLQQSLGLYLGFFFLLLIQSSLPLIVVPMPLSVFLKSYV